LSRNNCSAKRGIEIIFLSKPPRKHLSRREESVRDGVLDLVSASDEVHVIDHDRFIKTIWTSNISSLDARFDHVAPASKVALELRTDDIRTVFDVESIQDVRQ